MEIYYSILSVRKYFKGEYKIFVVGDRPKIPGIIHVPHKRIPNSRAHDITSKIQKIIGTPEINDDFLYMYDDQIFLKNCSIEDFKHPRAVDLVVKPGMYFGPNAKPSGKWVKLFLKTMKTLQLEGLPTWNYETHTPRLFNKINMDGLISKYNITENTYLISTLYYNNFELAPYTTLAQDPGFKVGLYEPHEMKWIEKNVPGHTVLSYDNNALNDNLRKFIKDYFKHDR